MTPTNLECSVPYSDLKHKLRVLAKTTTVEETNNPAKNVTSASAIRSTERNGTVHRLHTKVRRDQLAPTIMTVTLTSAMVCARAHLRQNKSVRKLKQYGADGVPFPCKAQQR